MSEGMDVAIDGTGKARVPVAVETRIGERRLDRSLLNRCLLLVPKLKGGLGTFSAVGSHKV
jgi:hypothetical protein